MGLAIRKAKKIVLRMGISKYEANKVAKDATVEKESKCLAEDSAGEGEK